MCATFSHLFIFCLWIFGFPRGLTLVFSRSRHSACVEQLGRTGKPFDINSIITPESAGPESVEAADLPDIVPQKVGIPSMFRETSLKIMFFVLLLPVLLCDRKTNSWPSGYSALYWHIMCSCLA
jgi:hypothetical protein